MATDRLIHYVCASPSHRGSVELGITRHDGGWALCPDLLSEDHDWVETGGLDVGDAVGRWFELAGLSAPRAA